MEDVPATTGLIAAVTVERLRAQRPRLTPVVALDGGRVLLADARKCLDWPAGTPLIVSVEAGAVTIKPCNDGEANAAMDRDGRVLVPVRIRRLLSVGASDRVLVVTIPSAPGFVRVVPMLSVTTALTDFGVLTQTTHEMDDLK